MELVANAEVILARVDHLLKSVVVAMHFHRVRNDRLDPIVVAHHLDGADHPEEGHVLTPRCLGEHLVVVTSDDQGRDRVARANLNRAVVSSKDHAIAWLHDCHRHAVVRNINRVLVRGAVRGGSTYALAHEVLTSHELLIHASSTLLLLVVHVSRWHPRLVEGLTKMLLKVCRKRK